MIAEYIGTIKYEKHRKDGYPQLRVEEVGLTLEQAEKYFNHFTQFRPKDGWKTVRFEIDDGKYNFFQLIFSKPFIPTIDLFSEKEEN